MALSETRWNSITPSAYAWERDALNFVREQLPDLDPYRVWANFEFIADDGSINEVDFLALTPSGFYLVEIKSWPGLLRGDSFTWTVEHEGRCTRTSLPTVATWSINDRSAAVPTRSKSCVSRTERYSR